MSPAEDAGRGGGTYGTYAMMDSLPDDDSGKLFIDMVRRFNVVAGKTEKILKFTFRKNAGIFTHGGAKKEISIFRRL